MTDINDILENFNNIILIVLALAIVYLVFTIIKNYIKKDNKTNVILKESSRDSAEGIIFGIEKRNLVFSPTNAEGHISVFGGSGVGKTSAILIPTLLKWKGTSLTIDISGDISKNVNIENKLVYQPGNADIPYNVFYQIDLVDEKSKKNELLEQLAFLMMPDNDDFSDASQFYNTEGRKILTASFIAFYFAGYDFIDTCKMVFQSSWKDLFSRIDETKNQDAIQYINSFEGASEQNTSGCKQACDAVIKLFATNETIQKSIGRPVDGSESFDPGKLETKNVFVVIDDSKLKLYAPLLHLITAQCLEFFSERSNESKTNILLCLDEFVSLGKLEITDALRKLRKKHVRIMILTQSMADIDLLYGKSERMAMMNNFSFKVILEASDTETQDYFAKLIGYKPTKKKSVSTSNVNTTKTLADDKEWIIEPAKLARLGDSLILLYREGYKLLKKNFYFKH